MSQSMSEQPRRKNRRLMLAGTAGAIVVAALGAALVFGAGDDRPPTSGSTSGEPAGDAMAGMNMSSDGSVHLTADQIRTFGITFGFAEERTLESTIRTVGIVTFDETRVAQVAPKFGGFLERLHVDFTGETVRLGQPLVEIYSPELVAAQEELLLAARLDASLGESAVPGVEPGSSSMTESAIRRLRLWDISDRQIREILRTGTVRRTLTLHAPVSGVVVEKPVVRGEAVAPGQTLYTIADLSEVWIEADLRERDAGSVVPGSAAIVELNAFPGRPLRGTVEYVYPTLERRSRTLKARISTPNPDGRLKPGMFATVRFSTPSRSALTVPSAAVVHTGTRAVVFVDMGGGRITPIEVEVGRVAGDQTEILAGLEPGQRVVTSAQYILDSESNMAEVMRSMVGMTGEAMEMDMDMNMDMEMPEMETPGTGGMEGMSPGEPRGPRMPMPPRRER
jgi:Cu(I)/Ag(I) efflux system membrane fusion protein